MKTTVTILALFATLVASCYMADKTGHFVYGFIQAATVLSMGAVLVRKLKLA